MKISTKSRYALRGLLELAKIQQSDKPVLLTEIAKNQEIPDRYLIQMFCALRQAGIIESVRGAHGGYRFCRELNDISLYDIIDATEGPFGLINCLENEHESCSNELCCISKAIWKKVNTEVINILKKYTLEDMLKATKQLS